MCGISTIVVLPQTSAASDSNGVPAKSYGGEGKASRRQRLHDEMQESLNKIKHRGPDASGVWISEDERIVLGHCRLSINDLSPSAHQPLHSSMSGALHAVVNGELYGFDAIKAKLSAEIGYNFTSKSDSEIVLALYQAYGLDMFEHLRGEFAFCLYDEEKKLFLAARDRYGIKPLFYTVQAGRLLVAAEAKAFLPLGWRPEWDVRSLVEGGWNFDDRTLFKDVRKVRPGCYVTCDASGKIEQRRYWDLEYPDKTVRDPRTEEEIVQGVRDRLVEAVRIRLRADVPIGVYLSGGIDSSVIAGLTAHLVNEQGSTMGSLPASERVRTFCVAFDKDSGFDESETAERTADFLGVQLHKQVMDEEGFASRLEDATWHCEHHNPDLNFVGKFALSELPRELGFKVVLTGEGSDEHFTGYHIYLPDYLREADASWDSGLPEDERKRLLQEAEDETRQYYTSIGADSSAFTSSPARENLNNISTPASMSAFIPPVFAPWTSILSTQTPLEVIAADIDAPVIEKIQQKWHPVNSAQYIWTQRHLPNQFMSCLGDRTEMAHSIEGRTPFLDHPLTEYVNAAPPSLKVRWNGPEGGGGGGEGGFTAKYLLREAMKPFVTEEIFGQRKHPYSAPLTYSAGGPLYNLLNRLITRENVEKLGFVSWEKTRDLVERAFAGKESLAFRLALVVAQWIVLAERFGVKTAKSPESNES